MKLPQLSHLQFVVMGTLLENEAPGREIRDLLAKYGHRRSGPAFYQLMARLEDAQLVDGRYEQIVVDGQVIKQRWYRVTAKGANEWRRCRDFYIRLSANVDQGGSVCVEGC